MVGLPIVVMSANIDVSQEILATDRLTALKSSFKHSRKHVLRLFRLYGHQAKAWSPYSCKGRITSLRRCFKEDFKALNTSTANIFCQRTIFTIITTTWRPSHPLTAWKICSSSSLCLRSLRLIYGDQALSEDLKHMIANIFTKSSRYGLVYISLQWWSVLMLHKKYLQSVCWQSWNPLWGIVTSIFCDRYDYMETRLNRARVANKL